MRTAKQMREQARARVEASVKAVKESGGCRLCTLLGADATTALERISVGTTKRAAIEAAIIKMDRENNT